LNANSDSSSTGDLLAFSNNNYATPVLTLPAAAAAACALLPADDYNLGQVLNVSLQFYEAQRSGKLPRISNTPWRGNSGLWDSVLLPNGKNYSLLGGWYDDGGMLKLSYTTAFTVSMLSWAFYEFKGGYRASGNADFSANTIRWGADYLMKVSVTNITSAGTAMQPIFVAQVRDGSVASSSSSSNGPFHSLFVCLCSGFCLLCCKTTVM
jgi:hypothetical protein